MPRLRATGDGDGVLPVAVDEDERDPGRLVRELNDAADVDPFGLQGRSGPRPNTSAPTAPTNATDAPSRAAATAALPPLPPWWR